MAATFRSRRSEDYDTSGVIFNLSYEDWTERGLRRLTTIIRSVLGRSTIRNRRLKGSCWAAIRGLLRGLSEDARTNLEESWIRLQVFRTEFQFQAGLREHREFTTRNSAPRNRAQDIEGGRVGSASRDRGHEISAGRVNADGNRTEITGGTGAAIRSEYGATEYRGNTVGNGNHPVGYRGNTVGNGPETVGGRGENSGSGTANGRLPATSVSDRTVFQDIFGVNTSTTQYPEITTAERIPINAHTFHAETLIRNSGQAYFLYPPQDSEIQQRFTNSISALLRQRRGG